MSKLKSFSIWLETENVADPNVTTDYIPSPSTNQNIPNNNDTIIQDNGPVKAGTIDPEIVKSVSELKDTHDKLRGIFGKIHQNAKAFRSPQMRNSFNRELTNGVDSVGRAHAMLSPASKGI